ncbi:hypothetical protein THAR02_02666 [Trichoderma harzianum]|uniref:CCHC-type domain-containing protein n=1 Tax=Trichoderma harzianum TaxID=5544 RepID=A0A0G0AK62_TRIHA|nr:hypothetical protein THAR02_02666 [Trichoderma harzianum]
MTSETPKGVSSRLLTMKFMQRAVASASSSPQQSDDSSQNSKKRKLRHSVTTAAEERVSALIDQASIKAALEDQEAKRQAALAQHTATGAHWVLNTKLDKLNAGRPSEPSLNVVYKPSASKDERPDEESSSHDEDDDDDSAPKRKNRRLDTGDSSSRSQSRSRPRFSDESKKAKDFREKRKKKDVRLNNISSISAGGGGGGGSQASMNCYVCKQPGHKAANCPKGASRR